MEIATHHSPEVRKGATGPAFAPSRRVTDPAVINPARLAALEKMGASPPPSKSDLAEMQGQGAPPFLSLDRETRTAVDTTTAAYHLNRQPQTLRGWACHEDGPIRPLRVNGRLAWPVAELRRVLGVA